MRASHGLRCGCKGLQICPKKWSRPELDPWFDGLNVRNLFVLAKCFFFPCVFCIINPTASEHQLSVNCQISVRTNSWESIVLARKEKSGCPGNTWSKHSKRKQQIPASPIKHICTCVSSLGKPYETHLKLLIYNYDCIIFFYIFKSVNFQVNSSLSKLNNINEWCLGIIHKHEHVSSL